jgi:hypothetical protein
MIAYAAYVGQRFDADAKSTKWRADVLFDIGVMLELATPMFPMLFLPLASLANVAKVGTTSSCFARANRHATQGIGGLAAGASKAALHRTLALRENLGDLTAKLYSQGVQVCELVVSTQTTFTGITAYLIGMGVGIELTLLLS